MGGAQARLAHTVSPLGSAWHPQMPGVVHYVSPGEWSLTFPACPRSSRSQSRTLEKSEEGGMCHPDMFPVGLQSVFIKQLRLLFLFLVSERWKERGGFRLGGKEEAVRVPLASSL